jgi:LysR family glycine cleavage system transcriptional activator
VIEPAVEAIRAASAEIRKPASNSLRIATSYSLAVEWLLPRLGTIRRELNIRVEPVIGRDPKMLRDQDVDLAIWGAIKPEPGGGEPLVTLEAIPVGAPLLADGRSLPTDLAGLVTCPLLDMRSPPDLWPQWLYSAGYRGRVPKAAQAFDTNQLAYEAAASGMGIALAVPLLANRFLESGRLLVCATGAAPTGMAYWIHHASPASSRTGQVRSLVEWLRAQAAASKATFATFASAQAQHHGSCSDLYA